MHPDICSQQLNAHLLNFLSSHPDWLNSWLKKKKLGGSRNPTPLFQPELRPLPPGGLELKAKEGEEGCTAVGAGKSAGSAPLASGTKGHTKNCCWDLSGGCWWLPTGFSFSLSLSPHIASQEKSAAETSSSQVGDTTSHRRVRRWGHTLQFLSSRFWGVHGSVGGRR